MVVYVERAEFGQDSTRRGVRGKIGLDDRSELRRAFRTASNDLRTCWRWTRTQLTEPTDDALRNERKGEKCDLNGTESLPSFWQRVCLYTGGFRRKLCSTNRRSATPSPPRVVQSPRSATTPLEPLDTNLSWMRQSRKHYRMPTCTSPATIVFLPSCRPNSSSNLRVLASRPKSGWPGPISYAGCW